MTVAWLVVDRFTVVLAFVEVALVLGVILVRRRLPSTPISVRVAMGQMRGVFVVSAVVVALANLVVYARDGWLLSLVSAAFAFAIAGLLIREAVR